MQATFTINTNFEYFRGWLQKRIEDYSRHELSKGVRRYVLQNVKWDMNRPTRLIVPYTFGYEVGEELKVIDYAITEAMVFDVTILTPDRVRVDANCQATFHEVFDKLLKELSRDYPECVLQMQNSGTLLTKHEQVQNLGGDDKVNISFFMSSDFNPEHLHPSKRMEAIERFFTYPGTPEEFKDRMVARRENDALHSLDFELMGDIDPEGWRGLPKDDEGLGWRVVIMPVVSPIGSEYRFDWMFSHEGVIYAEHAIIFEVRENFTSPVTCSIKAICTFKPALLYFEHLCGELEKYRQDSDEDEPTGSNRLTRILPTKELIDALPGRRTREIGNHKPLFWQELFNLYKLYKWEEVITHERLAELAGVQVGTLNNAKRKYL